MDLNLLANLDKGRFVASVTDDAEVFLPPFIQNTVVQMVVQAGTENISGEMDIEDFASASVECFLWRRLKGTGNATRLLVATTNIAAWNATAKTLTINLDLRTDSFATLISGKDEVYGRLEVIITRGGSNPQAVQADVLCKATGSGSVSYVLVGTRWYTGIITAGNSSVSITIAGMTATGVVTPHLLSTSSDFVGSLVATTGVNTVTVTASAAAPAGGWFNVGVLVVSLT